MFYEYAVDPAILDNIANFRTFCESFKNRPSRLIANLPKKWIQEAFSAINQMSHEECSPVMRKTLKENLKKLSKNNVCNNRPVDDWHRTQDWVDYAMLEHQKHPFSAIFASSPITSEPVYSFSSLFVTSPACWDFPSQQHLKRDADEMITAVMPLLCVSKKVWLVDPHFSLQMPSWGRYKALLIKMIEMSGKFNFGKGVTRIDIHTSDRNGGLQNQLEQKVKRLLPMGMAIYCFQWPESQMHDRFIITDIGGISFGHGLDENADGKSEEVLATVLENQTYKKEKAKLIGVPLCESVVVG